MAASTTDESTDNESDLHCFMCIFPSKVTVVKPFSEKTWSRFLECVKIWKDLEGEQAVIARNFLDRQQDSLTSDNVRLNDNVRPVNGGFHRECYSRFTDKQRIQRNILKNTEKLLDRTETDGCSNTHVQDNSDDKPPAEKTRRSLRSGHEVKGKTRSKHVLPAVCILCQKDKSIRCRSTQKRKRESLVKCSTINADKLLQAARDNNNTALMLQIQDRDCVAIELQYHNSCYRNFTRHLYKTPKSGTDDVDTNYSIAYKNLCDTINERIIDGKEIFRLPKLTGMFIAEVEKVYGIDVSHYKSGNLKTRLQKTFPQLCFMTPNMRSQGDIVYVNDISKSSVIQESVHLQESISHKSTDDETSESEVDHDVVCNNNNKAKHNNNFQQHTTLRDCYMTAISLRNTIDGINHSNQWPPTAEHLTLEAAEQMVPHQLYNFLAWTVGSSESPVTDRRVEVDPETHRKLLAISQDIIYVASKGKKQTPKHLSLAMSVRHLTGSVQLIGLLNGFGYCVSNSVTLNHDTAIAQQEMRRREDALPPNIRPRCSTTLVWDNNDFGEETLSGAGTTHNTNGIIIQPLPDCQQVEEGPEIPSTTKRTRERTTKPPPSRISTYYGGKKAGPSPVQTEVSIKCSDYLPTLKVPKQLDLLYNITKFDIEVDLPSWTGYNQLLSLCDIPPRSVIGYLPIIDANPTEMDTVLTILHRSVEIADKLHLETVVVVLDQAIYSKAQIIRWQSAEFMKRLVLRLGEFHTAMSFLGCIGKRFCDGGLQDIFIEAEVVTAGSVNSVISGKHYNRAIRAHKLVSEALHKLRFESYLQTVSEEDANLFRKLVFKLQTQFPEQSYFQIAESEEFQRFQSSFDKFLASGTPTFQYWNSYIDMVEILLLFLRATREADWNLHISSIRCMLPWFFAYDHQNYGRFLPAYWFEMVNLAKSHPRIHDSLLNGEFVVQRSNNPFAQIACDQTIEQTANRDSKTKGGMIGFTRNKGAVNRWIWSHHARGMITRECEIMAGKSEQHAMRTDLTPSRMKRDKADVTRIADTINNMVNPFTKEDEHLINIASGVIASDAIQKDLADAEERGEAEVLKFFSQRLQTNEVDLFETMKKIKLKTFTNLSTTVKTKVKTKEVSMKADRNLMARLVVIGRYRNIDLKELLSFNLGPFPLSLATSNGTLVKTNKANLLHAIEALSEDHIVDIPEHGVFVIDGMAMLQMFDIKKMAGPKTFLQLAHDVLKKLVRKALQNKSNAIHFVVDRYPSVSIKNAERTRRAASGTQQIRIFGQPLPQQWKKFLNDGKNKEALIAYFYQAWSEMHSSDLQGVKVLLAHGEKCHAFQGNTSPDEVVQCEEVTSLNSNQEEADMRMFLHAAYESAFNSDVIICSPDTDVFIIGLTMQKSIPANIFFNTGRGSKLRTISLSSLRENIGSEVCDALIGMHCFTGCDSTSAFYGMGKKKALKLLLSNKEFCTTFKQLGESFEVNDALLAQIELFTCRLYGQTNTQSVNSARYNMFRLANKSEFGMPPNQDALLEHIKRANFQSCIHKQCLTANPDVPSFDKAGWRLDGDELSINWMNLPPAPESVLELAHCDYRKDKCNDGQFCSCLKNKIACTEFCKCTRDCRNTIGFADFDDDSDEFEEDEDDEPCEFIHY